MLSLLLLTVAHIEEHGDGENREWNNGADNTCWISRVRSSYHSKSRFQDVPPTIAPVFGPLLESLSPLLESFVGSDELPVEVLVLVKPRVDLPELLLTVLSGGGVTSGVPDDKLSAKGRFA